MQVQLILVGATGEQQEFLWQADRQLARDMLAFLRDKLALQNKTFSDIAGIGVYRGPGSYTGLRIGITVMDTIATSNNVPIVGAIGDHWVEACLVRLEKGEDDKLVLPEYGGDANVTQPRK